KTRQRICSGDWISDVCSSDLPDHDVALALRRVPDRMREPARDPLEIGKNPVAPLVMQAIEGVLEKLAVIHRQTWAELAGAASLRSAERRGGKAGGDRVMVGRE